MNQSINPPIQGFCLSSSPAFAYPRAKAETKECLKPPHRLRYNPILELNGAIRESSSNRLLAVAASTASGGGQGDKNGSGGAPEGAASGGGGGGGGARSFKGDDAPHMSFTLQLYGQLAGASTATSSTDAMTTMNSERKRRAVPLMTTMNSFRIFHPEDHGFVHASSNPDKVSEWTMDG